MFRTPATTFAFGAKVIPALGSVTTPPSPIIAEPGPRSKHGSAPLVIVQWNVVVRSSRRVTVLEFVPTVTFAAIVCDVEPNPRASQVPPFAGRADMQALIFASAVASGCVSA